MKLLPKRPFLPLSLRRAFSLLACGLLTGANLFAGQFDAWNNSMKVTFNYSEWERLNNFPVLIILNPSIPGFSYTQFAANGQDLRFEDANGTALAYEIEKWDPNGSSYIWVRVPELVGDATKDFVPGQWLGNWSYNGVPRFYGGTYAGVKYSEQLTAWASDVVERRFISAEVFDDGALVRPEVSLWGRADPRPAAQGGADWRLPVFPNYTDGQVIARLRDGNGPIYARFVNGYWFAVRDTYDGPLVWADQLSNWGPVNGVPWCDFFASSDPENVGRWQALRFQNFDPRNPGFDSVSQRNYDFTANWNGHHPKPKTWIKAYWGNPAAPVYTDSVNGLTWSGGNWGGVWHMGDATARASRPVGLTPTSTGLQAVAGKVGGGVNFDGTRSSSASYGAVNWFNSGTTPNNAAYTIEAWVRRTTNGSGGPDISYGTNATGRSFSMGVNSAGNYRNVHNMSQDVAFSSVPGAGQWQHVALVCWPGGQTNRFAEQLYINGEFVRAREVNAPGNLINDGQLVFGREAWGSAYCGNVDMDEVRISRTSRSYNWIKCTYNTTANNSTFTTYGAVTNGLPLPTIWTAYNDIAWEAGQTENKITKLGPLADQTKLGNLLDYTTGSTPGVTMTFSIINGANPGLAGVVSSALPVSGSDADVAFTGKADLNSRVSWTTGSIKISLDGLNPATRYKVTLYGARGVSAYTTRTTAVTISDVTSFSNTSSTGSTILTTTVANDTARIVTGDNAAGRVFRFENIDPGSDGDAVITLTGNGTDAAYINAIRVSTFPNGGETTSPDSDGDGMSDAAEALFGTNPNSATSRAVITTGFNASKQPVIGWPTVNGRQYRVEYCDTLGAGWSTLTTITSNNGTASHTDTTTPIPGKRFYRIVAL